MTPFLVILAAELSAIVALVIALWHLTKGK